MPARLIIVSSAAAVVLAGSSLAAAVMTNTGSTAAARTTTVAEPADVASPAPATWDVAPVAAAPSPTTTAAKPQSHAGRTGGTLTYVVKRGDNLSVIAAWFKLHGYGALYDANRAVIGADPNLIFPGERITISGGHLTMSTS